MNRLRIILAALCFSVVALGQTPVIQTSDPLPEADVGSAYSVQLSATNSPTSWTITAGSLAACGLTVNTSYGSITGSPVAGLCSITVTANNGSGSSAPVTFTLAAFSTPICHQTSASAWTCGDAKAIYPALTAAQAAKLNGRPLESMMYYGPQFPCGSTITLAAGATYTPYLNDPRSGPGLGTDLQRAFHLPQQTCSTGQVTSFVSSDLGSMTFPGPGTWYTVPASANAPYLAHMAKLVGAPPPATEGTVLMTNNYAGNYYFGGIAFLSPPVYFPGWDCGNKPNCWNYQPWSVSWNRDGVWPDGGAGAGQNIEIDRCYLGSSEGFTYGTLNQWYHGGNNQADINTWETFFRGTNTSLTLEGDNHYVHDSVIEAGGYDWTADDAEVACDAGTNSNPAVVHCTGIAAKLGISFVSACYPNGPGTIPSLLNTGCYNAAGSPRGASMGVFRGARGGWGSTITDGSGIGKLNGAKVVLYKDADSVYIFDAWKEAPFKYDYYIDSTTWGPLSGSVQYKDLSQSPHAITYAFQSGTGGHGLRMIHNYLDSPGWNIFTGGTGEVTQNSAAVNNGSTWNTLSLTLDAGAVSPNVGDWMVYNTRAHTSVSALCRGIPGQACTDGQLRVGVVSSVSGTAPNLTVVLSSTNAGFSAVSSNAVPDMASDCPASCGRARWNGRTTGHMQIAGNVMWRSAPITGKGYIEFKACEDTLVTGNLFTGTNSGGDGVFINVHLQGWDPWVNCNNSEISYNRFEGDPNQNEPAWANLDVNGSDSEASTQGTSTVRLIHNLTATSTDGVAVGLGTTGLVYAHNTLPSSSSSAWLIKPGNDSCYNPINEGTYYTTPDMSTTGNILSYGQGVGPFHGSIGVNGCDSLPAGFNNNIVITNGSTPSWVATQGNAVAANVGAVGFVGTCDPNHWLNCALSPASAYKGSMPDGSDPGADVVAVQDRLNRWSERAGVIVWAQSQGTMINNPAAWTATSTTANLQFTSLDPSPGSNCSFHIYTNLARTIEHTDTAGGNSACSRAGNTITGTNVQLVFGGHASLSPNTTYAYSITNGSESGCVSDASGNCTRTMVGVFKTSAAGPPMLTGIRISGAKKQ